MADPSWRDLNQAMWNERLPLHLNSPLYDLPGFKAGALSLRSHEIEDLGDVSGKDLIHLQCHFGKDTLSWARLGARVTGVDFSEPAVRAAAELRAEIGVEARFVTSDVYDAPSAVGHRDLRHRLHRGRRALLAAGHGALGEGRFRSAAARRSALPVRVSPAEMDLRVGRRRSAGNLRRLFHAGGRLSRCGGYICGRDAAGGPHTDGAVESPSRPGGDGAGLGRHAGPVPARTRLATYSASLADDGPRRRSPLPHAARHALAAADVRLAGRRDA